MWKMRTNLRHTGLYIGFRYMQQYADIQHGYGGDAGLYRYYVSGQGGYIISDTIGPQLVRNSGEIYNYDGGNINNGGFFKQGQTYFIYSNNGLTSGQTFYFTNNNLLIGQIPRNFTYTDQYGNSVQTGDAFYQSNYVSNLNDGEILTFTPMGSIAATGTAFTCTVRWKIWKLDNTTHLYEPFTQSAINDGRKHITYGFHRWKDNLNNIITKTKIGKTYQDASGEDVIKYSSDRNCWYIGTLDDADGWWESSSPLSTATGEAVTFSFTFDPDNFSGVLKDDKTVTYYQLYTGGATSTLTNEYYGDIARWTAT